MNKLGLGTVQFGMNYGVSNGNGIPTKPEVSQILELAHESGIRFIDTACLYGISEATLGLLIRPHHGFSIVTKTPKFESVTQIEEAFEKSLSRLGKKSIYGLLVHDVEDLLQDKTGALAEKLHELKKRGLVQKIGASVDFPSQVKRLLEKSYGFDLIQVPVNLLDQRLIQRGLLKKLKGAGFEIHSRSAFLQGLLLMPLEKLPSKFAPIRSHLEKIHAEIQAQGLTMLQAALKFVLETSEIDRVIVGVSQKAELEQILLAAGSSENSRLDFKGLSFSDERFLNPSLWS